MKCSYYICSSIKNVYQDAILGPVGKGTKHARESTEQCGGTRAFHASYSTAICAAVKCEYSSRVVLTVHKDKGRRIETNPEDIQSLVVEVTQDFASPTDVQR